MSEVTCKLCGKTFKSIAAHVKMKHDLSMEEYNMIEIEPQDDFADEQKSTDLPSPKEEVSAQPVQKPVESKPATGKLLYEFLREHGFNHEEELVAIIEKHRNPVLSTMKENQAFGEENALKLKDETHVNTTNLHVAEALVKNYGFVVKEVTTKGGKQPKTWVLEKAA